jgi:hypothetical protein
LRDGPKDQTSNARLRPAGIPTLKMGNGTS